jgi:gliding motility-associated-like protein
MKFNDNGIRLWGTYFGSDTSGDTFNCITLDTNENVILGGLGGDGGITTPNAQIPNYIIGSGGIIVKFSPNGQQLYGSYFKIAEGIKKITRDSFGNVYVAGDDYRQYTTNANTTSGIHQQSIIGESNAYLAKLDNNFQFLWGTYFGGKNGFGFQYNSNEGRTISRDLKVDMDNNVILLGNTDSHERISTPGTHQTVRTSNLGNDIFLTKFSPSGQQIWGTYYGSTTTNAVNDDLAYGLSVDDSNNLVFSGQTLNSTQIATPNGFLPTNGGGYNSGFFTKFSTTGNQIWGSYFYRTIHSIYAKNNNIYTLSGVALVNNFAKFYDCTTGVSATSNSPVCINTSIQLNAFGGTSYSWSGPNGFTSNQQNPTIPNATIANAGTYTCQVTGSGACDGTFTVNVIVGDNTAPVPNTATLPDVTGDCHTIISTIPTATDNCAGTINATTTDPLSYSLPGTYVIHWVYNDGNGNTVTQNQNVIITAPALPTTINTQQVFCKTSNPTISDIQITGQNIKWYDAAGNILTSTAALINGQTYYASQTINGCESGRITIQVTVNETPKPTANTTQDFCSSANPTLANLVVTGTALQFYDAAGNVLPLTTPLINGTTYSVTQTLNNCESEKQAISVTLSNNNVPANEYAVTLCNSTAGNLMVVNLTSYQGNIIANPSNYLFSFTDTSGNPISNPTGYILNMGLNAFYVKVSTPDGCFKIVRLSITLNPKPQLSLPEKIDFCKGKSTVLDAGTGYTSYVWNTGATTQTITVSTPGNYSVTVTNNFGCQDTDNTLVSYTILPEIVSVNITNTTATIILSATGNFEYSLDNSAWQDSNVFTNLNMGEYVVYVRTKEGCIIGQKPFSIFNIPNAFTPNGDGFNDKWKITGLENYSGTEVSVYDRKGLPVFKETITKKPLIWDGKLNGNQIPTGTYWYVIKVSDGRVYTGWVLIKNRD